MKLGRCPSCGKSYFLNSEFSQCGWCGKKVCSNCLPAWASSFEIKSKMETDKQEAHYDFVGFCSQSCRDSFNKAVLAYPFSDIGTSVNTFPKNIRKLYYDAILSALQPNSALLENIIAKVHRAIELESDEASGILMGLDDDGTLIDEYETATDFIRLGYRMLASNLEKCGRCLDSAEVYETRLGMYDKAKQLRESSNRKQILVKHTNISFNLNDLLKQVRDGGLVVVYRCPHCNGALKIDKQTTANALKTCDYCHSKIETVDLAELLRTALL
jgi:hypothetical protein